MLYWVRCIPIRYFYWPDTVNPLNTVPPKTNTMSEHYQKTGCDADGIIKVLIIGNSSVGKSCMLARYSEGEFPEGQKATIGIDFKLRQLDIDGRLVKLQIWDTAGQEKFRTITRAYYRGATGVLIIYDVTDEKSFRDVNQWYESVEENTSSETVLVLCANKCDIVQEGEEGSSGGRDRRVVSTERGRALANEYDIPYFESSAKDDVGVDELFLEISKLCLQRSKKENERRRKEVNLTLGGTNRQRRPGDGLGQASCC